MVQSFIYFIPLVTSCVLFSASSLVIEVLLFKAVVSEFVILASSRCCCCYFVIYFNGDMFHHLLGTGISAVLVTD